MVRSHGSMLMMLALPTALGFGARAVGAQNTAQPLYRLSVSAGWHAPVANHSGMDDRNLMVIGVERRFVIVNSRFGTMALAPSLLPAVTTGHNRGTSVVPCDPVYSLATPTKRLKTGTSTLPVCFGTAPYSAFGGGVLPLAMRFETPTVHGLGFVASIDGGAVWFNQPIPVPAGTRFNFAARAGLDATLRVTNRTWLSAGYRHLHLSNAGLGATNPGIDAPMLSVGLGWR